MSLVPRIASPLMVALGGLFVGLALAEGLCRLQVVDEVHAPPMLWGTTLIPMDPEDLRPIAKVESESRYLKVDRALGWSIRPDGVTKGGLYQADAVGLRSLPGREPPDPTAPGVRVAAFGDSFTHCDEIPYEDSWPHLLEEHLGRGVRVFNGGVQGYGTDQAYLRFLEMRETIRPHIVILGLALADPIRNVNVFRTFAAGWTALTKPRFVLAGDGIELINRPTIPPEDVPTLIAAGDPLLLQDAWYDARDWSSGPLAWSVLYRFANARLRGPSRHPQPCCAAGSEPTEVTARIVIEFAREVAESGGRFICLVVAGRPRLEPAKRIRWRPLMDRLAAAGVSIVDVTEELLQVADVPATFAPKGHLARPGNEVVAQALAVEVGTLVEALESAGRRP